MEASMPEREPGPEVGEDSIGSVTTLSRGEAGRARVLDLGAFGKQLSGKRNCWTFLFH
jgi:hypothetical protein